MRSPGLGSQGYILRNEKEDGDCWKQVDLASEEAQGEICQRNQRDAPKSSDSDPSIKHGLGDDRIAFSVCHWDWLGSCENRVTLLTYIGPPKTTSEGVFTQQTEEEISVWSEREIGTLFKE